MSGPGVLVRFESTGDAQVSAAARRVARVLDEAAQSSRGLAAGATTVGNTFKFATSGLNMARSGAAQLAVQMVGAKSSTAALATGMLMSFGVSAGPLLAVTAGIAAIGLGFER